MNKQDYLAAAAQWKASYASLIVDIRQARIEYKNAQRAFAPHTPYDYSCTDEVSKAYWAADREVDRTRSHREALRHKATEMIGARHEMKREAGRAMVRV